MGFEWLKEVVDLDNIAEKLPSEKLELIATQIIEGHAEDKESRTEWESRQGEYMKLALQVMETKNTPWPNAANVKYPLLTTATMQFGARAYPGLVGSANVAKGKVTGFDPTGEKAKSAQRIGLHMSYQLLDEMDEWEDDMDQLCLSLPIVGCMFKKTYYSPAKGRNVCELVYPRYLVVNYWTRRLSTAPRITHEIHLQDNDIIERINAGLFLEQDYDKEEPDEEIITDQVHGIHAPRNEDTTPSLFLEQHCWLDLDEDGYKEPYIVTVAGGKVARIVAAFELDSVKVRKGKIVSIQRIEYFTKYGFVPNPDGSFYDIGLGLLLGPINDTINTTINQLLDAGTMSNRSAGFLGRGARLKGGEHSFNPFEWKQVMSTGDDLRKSIVPLPVREPSSVLFNLLGLMIESGKELSSTVPMLLGQNPGQNQPASTSMAVIDQGLKVYSSILKRLHRALKFELKKLKRLNGIYLPEKSYFQILDPQLAQGQDPSEIYRTDYQDDVTAVIPYSDPAIVSEVQRMIKAQQLSEMMQQGLIPNKQAAVKIVLEAMDLPNVDELITPPEPQPDPEIELKKAQAQHAKEIDIARLDLEREKLDLEKERLRISEIKDETIGMLNLAKAEAEEFGVQRNEYKAQLDEISETKERELKEKELEMKQQQMQQAQQQAQQQAKPNGQG
jgi:chaperonin GroES